MKRCPTAPVAPRMPTPMSASIARFVVESFQQTEAELPALEKLTKTERAVLEDLEAGFSYKEIAEILDIPIGTVMSRLHRGRKALQRQLYEFAKSRHLTSVDRASDD